MNMLLKAIRRLFGRRHEGRCPAPSRAPLQELRRPQTRRWEIRPPSSECEMPFGPDLLGSFNHEMASRSEAVSDRIKIRLDRTR